MALIFERIQTDGIAELSYLVGDDSEGVAAVFDPRPDVDCYLELAREKQVSITHTASAERFNSTWHRGSPSFAFLSAVSSSPRCFSNCEEL